MRILAASLVLLGGLAGAGLAARPGHLPRPAPCGPCRATDGYLLPTSPAMHAAMRFVDQHGLISPPGPFATYSNWYNVVRAGQHPYGWHEQLRFGNLYLVKGPSWESEGQRRYLQSVYCVRGQDTMQVYVQPPTRQYLNYWCYDSIPFRAGRYELREPAADTVRDTGELIDLTLVATEDDMTLEKLEKLGVRQVSFAAYYRQHQAELARDNPFAGCRFRGSTTGPTTTADGYIPRQPTEVFNLLLAHTTYLKFRGWHLRQLARHEQAFPKN